MADTTPTSSGSLARSPSNAEIDTSAPFASVRAAKRMFETDGEKSKAPMPPVGRTGSVKSGEYLSKPQGLNRSRENSLDESKPRANLVTSPNSATSEYRGLQSPPNQNSEKLEADLKDARAQVEEAHARAAAETEARREEEAKRLALERELLEYRRAAAQLQEEFANEQAAHKQVRERAAYDLANEQAAHKQARERADAASVEIGKLQAVHRQAQDSATVASAEVRKLQAALEKERKDHADKVNQVQAALSAMQTTNDAHDETQAQLAASKQALKRSEEDLKAAQASLALSGGKAADASAQARRNEEALQQALGAAEAKTKDASASAKLAREAEEKAKHEAAVAVEGEGKARAELARALSEVDFAKKTNATMDSKLEAALKELELAHHAEELARKRTAEDQAAREKAEPASPLNSTPSGVYTEEIAIFQQRLAEAEATADKRVAAVTAQLNAAKSSEEEAKAKLEALSTKTTTAEDSSTRQELEAALADAEQTKKALQAESDKVHDAGVNISIAQAKEKQALDRVAALEREKAALEARLSELNTKSTVVASTSNGRQPAHEVSSEVLAESNENPVASSQVQPKPQEADPKAKKQPVCCVVM